MDLDPGDAVGAAGQRLGRRLEHVLAQRHPDLRGARPRHAVPRRYHIPLVHQRPAAPRGACKINSKVVCRKEERNTLLVQWIQHCFVGQTKSLNIG